MEPDDAVDLLTELDQERRLPILPAPAAPRSPSCAACSATTPRRLAGLMNPDFVSVPARATVGEALEAVKSSTAPPEAAGVVFVIGDEGSLQGTALLVDLLRANPADSVAMATRPDPPRLPPKPISTRS